MGSDNWRGVDEGRGGLVSEKAILMVCAGVRMDWNYEQIILAGMALV